MQREKKKGSELSKEDQKYVLSSYIYRYTGDHVPQKLSMCSLPLHFKDDKDWLEHSLFKVKDNGSLDLRARYCESYPTYPNNPELRK